jgi:hypothetical protein
MDDGNGVIFSEIYRGIFTNVTGTEWIAFDGV